MFGYDEKEGCNSPFVSQEGENAGTICVNRMPIISPQLIEGIPSHSTAPMLVFISGLPILFQWLVCLTLN